MASIVSEIEQLISRLTPETRRQRQSALLGPLNISLVVLTLIGLVPMFFPKPSSAFSFTIVGLSLSMNLAVWALDRAGRTGLAALIFSLWLNLGILLLAAANLLIPDSDLGVGVLFACQLALSVILVGLLLSSTYAFLFAFLNIVTLIWLFWRYFTEIVALSVEDASERVTAFAIPISAFLVLIALITWLYQRALTRADERIGAARERIIKDELIRRDLAIARDLQLRLYPPLPVTNPALQLAARSVPAHETSGDFYDFIELGDEQIGIVVADVTGKSIAAALMMALARVAIRSEARRHRSPAEVLRNANETICRDHTALQLITAFYGVLDLRSLSLRFASAGHPYPLLRRGDDLIEIELSSLPLGGSPATNYVEQSLTLVPGDQLFIISDGLIEERNRQRELFGYDRLLPAILASNPVDPAQAIEDLWQTVASFRGDINQGDDMTLVVVQAVPVADAVDIYPSDRQGRMDADHV
jgi:hypothetical protein